MRIYMMGMVGMMLAADMFWAMWGVPLKAPVRLKAVK